MTFSKEVKIKYERRLRVIANNAEELKETEKKIKMRCWRRPTTHKNPMGLEKTNIIISFRMVKVNKKKTKPVCIGYIN